MSVQTFDLISQLQLLADKAQELGHLLIMEADDLINHQTISHQELLQQLKTYLKQKQSTEQALISASNEYGVLQLQELQAVHFDHLNSLMLEIEKRRNHKTFMEEKLLSRIHALPKIERESLLLIYTGCLQEIKAASLWESCQTATDIQNYNHPIWQKLRSTEIVHEQRQQELEAFARERLSHVTALDTDTTLDLLSGKHHKYETANEKQTPEKETAINSPESNLIFDDTFEIGKNMSLLKGRDMFPVTPQKKSSGKIPTDNPDSSSANPGFEHVLGDDDSHTGIFSEITPRTKVSDSNVPASPDFIASSISRTPETATKNKSPLQKLRLDHDKATLLADLVLQNRGISREHRKLDLVWELIRQRRFGLASLVAQRCEEIEHAPPPWLLRVLALTSSLYLPQGEVNKAIEKELYHFKPQVWAASHQEDQQALGYLLRASVLRLSLINPGKISSSILKSFSIKDGEVQLYNFCSRLVYFGQNFPRLGSLLLSPSSARTPTPHSQGKSAAEEITFWIKQVRDNILHFKESALIYTTPNWSLFRSSNQQHKQALWSYIAATFFLKSIYKMLNTIRTAERGATSRVRQDLSRIREGLNQPQHIGLKLPREFQLQHILPDAIQDLIQQGLSIADRWLVAEIPATANPVTASQDVKQLRDEVHKRYSAVMQELSQLRFESQSEARILSIDCLMEAFQDLRQLVDQKYELPQQEVNPEHVIYQELLRSHLTDFDEKWQPRATPQEQEQAILDLLIHPEHTWVVAMKRITGRGAWPMLHELREIPNLLSSHEQAELEQYLKFVDEPLYRNVMLQLAQLQQEMKQAEQLRLITAEEFRACHWRLMQISEENPAHWQLDELKQEIEYLKKFLDKKRQEEQAKIQARFAELNQKISIPPGYPGKSLYQDNPTTNQSESSQNPNLKNSQNNTWIIDL